MHEVLVWAPFGHLSSTIERRLQGHDVTSSFLYLSLISLSWMMQGSIFFVSFAPSCTDEDTWTLASGSDDRSVRLWHWRRNSESAFWDVELYSNTDDACQAVM
jgi:WD40 repeat protein